MSTGKEYNELILDLLKEQGSDISDIKEDLAELKNARHVIKEHKEWKKDEEDNEERHEQDARGDESVALDAARLAQTVAGDHHQGDE